jgi:Asp-tRNA(Asn)/Glu-tRNA(Gln) amidotransferase A subunit family amidase
MPEPRTITEAAEFIRRGELTPIDLLDQCLARIDRYEPKVRAWVIVDRDGAREQAERLTAELKAGQNRGPLHGVPIGIKDIIDVFDLPTGCGSKLWANSYARRDATVVTRLRQAGAIILGKTVTTPYASFDPSITRNPWNLERTPGGSSSGSAAAVACGMCFGALATQTGGSITRPAAYCGVYGLKVTYNRIQLDGILPLAPSMDHMGCMAKSVRDLEHIYRTIAIQTDYSIRGGCDFYDPLPIGLNWGLSTVRKRMNTPGMGLQFTNDFFPQRCEKVMLAAFGELIEKCYSGEEPPLFAQVVLPAGFGEILTAHRTIMAAEAAAYHGQRMKRHPDDYPPRITSLIKEGLSGSAAEYKKSLDLQWSVHQELCARDTPAGLAVPATTGPAPSAETTGDPAFNSPWSFLGNPVISMPFAWTRDGLPLSIQLVGEQWSEDELFRRAEIAEEAIGFTPRPLPL